jgi:hypothetical protein
MNYTLEQRSSADMCLTLFIIINRRGLLATLAAFKSPEFHFENEGAGRTVIRLLEKLQQAGYDNIPAATIQQSYPMPLIRCRPHLVGSIRKIRRLKNEQ